ncbi:MAG TPA: hypothetical protein P5513_04375 [Candidatus Diapherotrites archaeon]|nr:hypothetical protein [Candidatus Diapherotrites archaeon]
MKKDIKWTSKFKIIADREKERELSEEESIFHPKMKRAPNKPERKRKTKVREKKPPFFPDMKEAPKGQPLSTIKEKDTKQKQKQKQEQDIPSSTSPREFSLEDYMPVPQEFLQKNDFVLMPTTPTETKNPLDIRHQDLVKRRKEKEKTKNQELQKREKTPNELALPKVSPFAFRGTESPVERAELLETLWSYFRRWGISDQIINDMKKHFEETGELDVSVLSDSIPGGALKLILEDLEETLDRDKNAQKIEKYLKLLHVPNNVIQTVIDSYKQTGEFDITSLPVEIRPYFINTKKLTSLLRMGRKTSRSDAFFQEEVVEEAKERFPILRNYVIMIPNYWEGITDDKYFPLDGEADIVDKNGKIVGTLSWTIDKEEYKDNMDDYPRTYVHAYTKDMTLKLNKAGKTKKDKILNILSQKIIKNNR